MARLDRLREARLVVQRAAVERYQQRTAEREENKRRIAENGPGAADSPERQMTFRRRVSCINRLRSGAAPLPFGIERKMGATLDFVDVVPSDTARKAGRSVARIAAFGGSDIELEGFATGFIVAPGLLMTNWHVFPSEADCRNCAANFLYEKTERGLERGIVFEIDADRFYVTDQKLDFAIVAVKPRAITGEALADLGQNTLIEATPKILKGDPVNIIQHPEGGPKQYAISQNRLVDILDAEGFLHYETDTLEGSSGSPAFSENWELVALHHASIPQMRNGRVVARDGSFWTKNMGDDKVHWIANEGARVSAIVRRLSAMVLQDTARQQILNGLLATTTDPVQEAMDAVGGQETVQTVNIGVSGAGSAAQGTAQGVPQGGSIMGGVQFTFTGPVTINVNAGGGPVLAAPLPVTAPELPKAEEKSIRFDPDYDSRGGYDPDFLGSGISVPVPSVAEERLHEILKDEDGKPLVLRYHHFELMMNKPRRLQMWSAVNVDYDPRYKSEKNREEFGRDRWIPDPRIPAAVQIFDADFYKPAGNIDRGHMVRRQDNAWGETELEIEFANSDTFHWTNCTPQHEAFNQSTPGAYNRSYAGMEGLWGALENHIQQSRKDGDTKACILAGPILSGEDPSADFGRGEIQYPIEFWKIVCVAEGPKNAKQLKVFGFILSQKTVVDRFGIERFGPGRFKRHQVPLTEIASKAGVVFDGKLLDRDTMAGQQAVDVANLSDVRGLG
ncbi:endonuclease G [Xaviernesmea oryzae]|uniref:Endonuclease G n=1 Tax=Xaviernesmea oryzae TaxID=464029 RepID=A0A1X7GUI8_9HYPH|nr:DNA/RNA non-specific endonuclease [Xaviernesmea oryzae]SMF74985.1 endonuclease G [Xaviernesmea oryzae]